jgi:lysophospholipase L1-like esterase
MCIRLESFDMMKYWLLIGLLVCTTASVAQTLSWDSTARPEIYPSQVALFRSFEHSHKDIVFLGNSITFWGGWNELLHSKHIRNRGIPGDNTFGVLERLDEVIDGQPAKVFILIGINDIAKNIPDSVIVRNYERIISRLKAGTPRTKIYFQTLLPVNDSFKKLMAHYQHARIRAINEQIRLLATREHITLIDLYPHFAGPDGQLPTHLTFDGVHLQKAGYDIWVKVLKDGGYLQ